MAVFPTFPSNSSFELMFLQPSLRAFQFLPFCGQKHSPLSRCKKVGPNPVTGNCKRLQVRRITRNTSEGTSSVSVMLSCTFVFLQSFLFSSVFLSIFIVQVFPFCLSANIFIVSFFSFNPVMFHVFFNPFVVFLHAYALVASVFLLQSLAFAYWHFSCGCFFFTYSRFLWCSAVASLCQKTWNLLTLSQSCELFTSNCFFWSLPVFCLQTAWWTLCPYSFTSSLSWALHSLHIVCTRVVYVHLQSSSEVHVLLTFPSCTCVDGNCQACLQPSRTSALTFHVFLFAFVSALYAHMR